MEYLLLFISILAFAGVVYLLFLRSGSAAAGSESTKMLMDVIENLRKSINESEGAGRRELQTRLDVISKQLQDHQHKSLESIQKQFSETSKIVADVTKQLTSIKETNRQVVGFAEQLKSLENILKNPKQRGILGEYFLESLLSQVLSPAQYQMQYKFKNGEIVDSVIFFNQKIIPIDAKFSLEKYNLLMSENDKARRDILEKEFKIDLKNRIDETSKYIRPAEDTTDFAFMFIPAEGIYYNLLVYNVGSVEVNTQDLIEYAFKKHVIIVSPTSFFAYLETVLQGLKALKMEESVQEIIKKIGDLGRHLGSYETYMTKLGNNLGTTVSMYNQAHREFRKIDRDIFKITDGTEGGKIEALLLDKPADG